MAPHTLRLSTPCLFAFACVFQEADAGGGARSWRNAEKWQALAQPNGRQATQVALVLATNAVAPLYAGSKESTTAITTARLLTYSMSTAL